jgi:hypothetical protein
MIQKVTDVSSHFQKDFAKDINHEAWIYQMGPIGIAEDFVKPATKNPYQKSNSSNEFKKEKNEQKIKSEENKIKVEPKNVEIKKAEPKPEPPKPRVARKLTADQQKAITTFAQYNEKLDACSDAQEIKAAYRKLAKKYHPDHGHQNSEIFKVIAKAYRELVKGF